MKVAVISGIIFGFLVLAVGLAQSFTGEYFLATDSGGLTLRLEQTTTGQVIGSLQGNNLSYSLEGQLDDVETDVAYGLMLTPDERFGFEAYLAEAQLYLYVFGVTETGEIDVDNASELIFSRQSGSTTAATNPNPLTPATANPLAGNPIAADPYAGHYSGDGLRLELESSVGQYQGVLEVQGNQYPVIATADSQGLSGTFQVGSNSFSFQANLQGNSLILFSDGVSYTLSKDSASANPLASSAPANPLATPAAAPAPSSPVLASGQHADLSQDDALAFIEALEFSMAQVGYAYSFSPAEQQEILQLLGQNFAALEQHDQVVLSQARDIWQRVQANWTTTSDDDKREFVLAVFILAFGEDTVQQWLASNQGQQAQPLESGGGCSNFDDCAGRFVDEQTWSNTFNSQGCWAAAGCESYDSSTGTFTYNDY